jgi:hypothetical protein
MLQGKQIKLQVEVVVEVFKLPYTKVVVGGKRGYNVSIAKYFIGGEIEHYVPRFKYFIAKANGPLKVMKLIVIMEVITFRQGTK